MPNRTVEPHNSSLWNLDANIVALLGYLVASALMLLPGVSYLAWAVPLVIYLMESKSSFVKHHAMQSFVIHAISTAIGLILNVLVSGLVVAIFAGPFTLISLGIVGVLTFVTTIINIAILVFSILAMVKSYQYNVYNIPFISPLVQWVSKLLSGINAAGGSVNSGTNTSASADTNAHTEPNEQASTEASSNENADSTASVNTDTSSDADQVTPENTEQAADSSEDIES